MALFHMPVKWESEGKRGRGIFISLTLPCEGGGGVLIDLKVSAYVKEMVLIFPC